MELCFCLSSKRVVIRLTVFLYLVACLSMNSLTKFEVPIACPRSLHPSCIRRIVYFRVEVCSRGD
jgi:hypothetical protein